MAYSMEARAAPAVDHSSLFKLVLFLMTSFLVSTSVFLMSTGMGIGERTGYSMLWGLGIFWALVCTHWIMAAVQAEAIQDAVSKAKKREV